MKRLFKWMLGLGFGLTLLTLCMVLAASYILQPNNLKPTISKAISAKIGHPVELKGEIKLNLFPNIALKTQQVLIKNPTGFEQGNLAEVDEITLHLQLAPLLKKQILVDKLRIDGLNLFLRTNAKGQSNWEAQTAENTPEPRSTPTNKKQATTSLPDFHIRELAVTKGHAHYIDDINQQQYELENLDFKADAIHIDHVFPVKLNFKLTNIEKDSVTLVAKTAIEGKLAFSGLDDIILRDTRTHLKLWLSDNPPQSAILTGMLHANLMKQQFTFKEAALAFDDTKAKGQIMLTLADKIGIDFSLEVDQIDLNRYQQQTSQQPVVFGLPVAYAESTAASHQKIHKMLALKGQLNIDALKVADLKLTKIKVTAKSTKRGIDFNPIQTSLYNGEFKGKAQLDLSRTLPHLHLQGQAKQVNMAPLLAAFSETKILSGKGQLAIDISTQGLDQPTLVKHLNGTANCKISQGKIENIDLPYYYYTAQSLIKSDEDAQTTNRKFTPFDSLTATITAKNGTLHNPDLRLAAPRFSIEGEGHFDLPKETMNYRVSMRRLTATGQEKDKVPAILKISGPITAPNVAPDLEAMAKPVLKEEINRQINKQLNKLLKNEAQEEDAQTPEQSLENKINKELNKGLKKLFSF